MTQINTYSSPLVRNTAIAATLLAVFTFMPPALHADSPAAVTTSAETDAAFSTTAATGPAQAIVIGAEAEENVDRRIAFIQERLDARQAHANWWKYGFTGIVGSSMLFQFGRSQVTNDPDDRIAAYVATGSSFLGTMGMLISPVPNGSVANELRAYPSATTAERLVKLHVAEVILAQTAAGERRGVAWTEYLLGGIVSTSTAALLWGVFDQPGSAALSMGSAILFTGSRILLTPQHAIRAEAEYESAFLRPAEPEIAWSIVPYPGGLGVAVDF